MFDSVSATGFGSVRLVTLGLLVRSWLMAT